MTGKVKKAIISYGIVILMIVSLVLTRANVRNLVSFALPDSQEFTIGDHVTATWMSGTITIQGSGATYDYTKESPSPFYYLRNQTNEIVIEEGITGVGSYLFYNFGNVTGTLILPKSLLTIGDCAFSGDSKEEACAFRLIHNLFVTQDVMVDVATDYNNVAYNTSDFATCIGVVKETENYSILSFLSDVQEGENTSNGENSTSPEIAGETTPEGNNGNPSNGNDGNNSDNNDTNSKNSNSTNPENNNSTNPENNNGTNPENGNGSNVENGTNSEGMENVPNGGNTETGSQTQPDGTQGNNAGGTVPETGLNGTKQNDIENESQEDETKTDAPGVEESDEEETEEETEDEPEGDSVSGNNVRQELRTVSEQLLGISIFYPGQVGGYTVQEETNRSFIDQIEAVGYGRYLGTKQVSMEDTKGTVCEVSLFNTQKGVILPTLEESGLRLPNDTEHVHYVFSCWEDLNGNYYFPGEYSEEVYFSVYMIKQYVEEAEQTLSIALDEDTSLSVTGTFPLGCMLTLSQNDMIASDGMKTYMFHATFILDGLVYEAAEERELVWLLESQLFDASHVVKISTYDSESSFTYEVIEQKDGYAFTWKSSKVDTLCVSIQDVASIPENVVCNIYTEGLILSSYEDSKTEILDNELQVPYGKEMLACIDFEQQFHWPVTVTFYDEEGLLFKKEFVEDNVWILQDGYTPLESLELFDEQICFMLSDEKLLLGIQGLHFTQNVTMEIKATKKSERMINVQIGTDNQVHFDWLHATQERFATIDQVNELEGFTICYEAEEEFLPENLILCKKSGVWLPNTEVYVMAQNGTQSVMGSKTLTGTEDSISLKEILNQQTLDQLTKLQVLFDFHNADLMNGNQNLYLQLEEIEEHLLTDNGVMVHLTGQNLSSLELYLDNGSGVAKKDAIIYEGTGLKLHVLKKEENADWYRNLVLAFYMDEECRIPASLPKDALAMGDGVSVRDNVLILNNGSGNQQINITGLGGEKGFTPGQTYYVKAYADNVYADSPYVEKKNVVHSDVVRITMGEQTEYDMIVNKLDESLVIQKGYGLPKCQILYEVRNHGSGVNYQIKAQLSQVTSSEEGMQYQLLKDNIISSAYTFQSNVGTTAGSFENVKLIIPADLESGMYQIQFQMLDSSSQTIYANEIYYFVVE